jgi:hypothetical protein
MGLHLSLHRVIVLLRLVNQGEGHLLHQLFLLEDLALQLLIFLNLLA